MASEAHIFERPKLHFVRKCTATVFRPFYDAKIGRRCPDPVDLGTLLAGCASLPDDGKDAKLTRYDGLRAMRYCEVFPIGGNAVTKDLKAVFYNSTDLNNKANPRDTCPAAMWAKVDTETMEKAVRSAWRLQERPAGWANDWIELPVGTVKTFDGLDARWYGEVQLPKEFGKSSVAYIHTTEARNRRWVLPRASRCSLSKAPTVCRG